MSFQLKSFFCLFPFSDFPQNTMYETIKKYKTSFGVVLITNNVSLLSNQKPLLMLSWELIFN